MIKSVKLCAKATNKNLILKENYKIRINACLNAQSTNKMSRVMAWKYLLLQKHVHKVIKIWRLKIIQSM